jgi:hypothetical protein
VRKAAASASLEVGPKAHLPDAIDHDATLVGGTSSGFMLCLVRSPVQPASVSTSSTIPITRIGGSPDYANDATIRGLHRPYVTEIYSSVWRASVAQRGTRAKRFSGSDISSQLYWPTRFSLHFYLKSEEVGTRLRPALRSSWRLGVHPLQIAVPDDALESDWKRGGRLGNLAKSNSTVGSRAEGTERPLDTCSLVTDCSQSTIGFSQ